MNDQLPKAILLDMDDTILAYDQGVDTDGCWRKSIQDHLAGENNVNPEDLLLRIKERASWHWSDPERHRVGRLDLYKARQEIIGAALMKFNIDDQALAGNIARTYGEERDKAVSLFPNAIETIRDLRSRGLKLALLTNGNAKPQWEKIRKFGLAPFFDCILVEGEFGIGKPDERIYFHAVKALDVRPEDTWMVGDNYQWEIVAPQRIGIKGIWIDHKGQGIPSKAEDQPYRIIRALPELTSILKEIPECD
ncbi:HAD family hydrolase [Paenibacillus cremeus]|uniref:HAD family hydrolase n=1 Tax=Paenibacillus cremeus TaxID=2163881 RepID=A0A559K932_9BACL|nr:HAD family hydrolase [Paenibacillus cremeus]TVY08634.1 HAD family hydrolase [Paenibacillus cremeus]